jgi:NAD(P)-dependent dehydrogenase (short-subunit alcohol dehydrogenase family)
VAFISGSGHGIGRATALEMARLGATVGVNDLKSEFVDAVVAEITAAGGKAIGITQNVATREGMREAVLGLVARDRPPGCDGQQRGLGALPAAGRDHARGDGPHGGRGFQVGRLGHPGCR